MSYVFPDLRTLVLNADMQPLSWGPLSVWPWQDALIAVLQERVHQVSTYEPEVRSVSRSFRVPSVVALKQYRKRTKVSFTRYHVFLRDGFRCQYCGGVFAARDLTFDHIVPRSRGGRTAWTNIVTACARDNLRKGNKTLKESGMTLRRHPSEPTSFELDRMAKRLTAPDKLHETWLDFLYWDVALED